jgi:DNA-binding NtrC family response regulator
MGSGKPRVLVVDTDHAHDNPLARAMMGREFELVAVKTPFEVVALVTSGSRYDAIVCDLEMPSLSGAQLFDKVQNVDAAQASRMLVVTRFPDHPKVKAFVEKTGVHVMPRSTERDALRAAVNEMATRAS